ncbi:MAG: response regulator [Pseudomonadota bacterium]|nr:response regulator [Pseudomonadota bacterium]
MRVTESPAAREGSDKRVADSRPASATRLRDEGHEVYSVFDGQDVLEAVRNFQPDVVLLDIGMPKLTGYDVARKLRETHGKALRLIAVTGWKQGSDRVLAKIAGFNHHIGKPYDPRALIELLAKATREDS